MEKISTISLRVAVQPLEGSNFWRSQKFEGTLQGANQFLSIGQQYECQDLTPGTYLKHQITLSTWGGVGVGKVSYSFRYDLEKGESVSIVQEGRDAIECDLETSKMVGIATPVRVATLKLLDALLVQDGHRLAESVLEKLMSGVI